MKRNELVKEIANKLKKIRASLNYSRVTMARAINAGQTTYYRNEAGSTSPISGTITKLQPLSESPWTGSSATGAR